MSVRIATFNVENLMTRFDFEGVRNSHRRDRALSLFSIDDPSRLQAIEQARMIASTDDTRQMTALAIADAMPDIICLQEVENLDALDAFEYGYLFKMASMGFRQKHIIDGNDGRGINVALAAREETAAGEKIEILKVTSHAQKTYRDLDLFNDELKERRQEPDDKIFRRDCLEVDLKIGGKPLSLFLCHFKSMGPKRDGMDGRTYSMPIRRAEAKAVRKIIENKFGDKVDKANWMICGDLNAYTEIVKVGGGLRKDLTFTHTKALPSSIDTLLDNNFAEDLISRRDEMDRWTLYHSRGLQERHLCQLDYLIASKALSEKNDKAVPDIIRAGQPWRTPFPPGQEVELYPRTGWDRPKASDHCAVVVELSL